MNIDQLKILLKQLTQKAYSAVVNDQSSITDFIMLTFTNQMAKTTVGDVQFQSGNQQQIQDRPGFYFFNQFRFAPSVIERTPQASGLAEFTWSYVLPNLKVTPLDSHPETAEDYLDLGEIWIDDNKSLEACGEAILKRYGYLD